MISVRDLKQFRDAGLCSDGLDNAIRVLGESTTFPTFRAMAEAYLESMGGEYIQNVVRAAALIVPGKVDGWKLAQCMFLHLPKSLKRYKTILGPDNWKEAVRELRARGKWFEVGSVDRALNQFEEPDGSSESDVLAYIAYEAYDISAATVPYMLTLVCQAVDGS